jgi:hypothetical protein
MSEQKIVDKCPSCGSTGTLFVGEGGYLTCSLIGCPQPGVTQAIDQLRAEKDTYRARSEITEANLESYMELQAENKKLCSLLAERYETYLKVCAEAHEMRGALELIAKEIVDGKQS